MIWADVTAELWRPPGRGELTFSSIRLPWRSGVSTGSLQLPVCMVDRGPGPTILVCGGTHGDEFEGQVAASHLCRNPEATIRRGRLIVLPHHNPAAVLAGSRHSALDGRDLNRAFDGSAGDEPTQIIARFVTERLLPLCDWVLDLHSGGRSHDFLLSGNIQAAPGSVEDGAMREALLAFGAPWALIFDDTGTGSMPHRGTLEAAARRLGVHALSSELGGAGRLTTESLKTAANGIRNILAFLGMVDEPASPPTAPDRVLVLDRSEQTVTAPMPGLFLSTCKPGEEVVPGDRLGSLFPLEDGHHGEPVDVTSPVSGVVLATHAEAFSHAGTVLVMIARRAAP